MGFCLSLSRYAHAEHACHVLCKDTHPTAQPENMGVFAEYTHPCGGKLSESLCSSRRVCCLGPQSSCGSGYRVARGARRWRRLVGETRASTPPSPRSLTPHTLNSLTFTSTPHQQVQEGRSQGDPRWICTRSAPGARVATNWLACVAISPQLTQSTFFFTSFLSPITRHTFSTLETSCGDKLTERFPSKFF